MWWPMGKFFFRSDEREGQYVTFAGSTAHHMLNVLRLQPGQNIVLCDGACTDYHARLESVVVKPARVTFFLLSSTPSNTETIVPITLYQGMPKGEKMDWIIEKCVELGVSKIVPVCTARTIVKTSAAAKKAERFARIAESAAGQSMRGIVPEILSPLSFAEALAGCSADDLTLVAYEKEQAHTAKSVLAGLPPRPLSLWIGPEGGFEDGEVQALAEKGGLSISLGPRILRTETAGIVALSQILCIWE